MGPKCQNGPKKVPILLPSPKFLILPSDDAEKGRHIAVSHCCVLFGHTQCIMCMSLILSSPIIFTDRWIYFEMGNFVTAFFAFVACFFLHFRENNDKVPESSINGPKKVPILPEFCLCKDFLSQVPNPIFFFGAPVDVWNVLHFDIKVQKWSLKGPNFAQNVATTQF